ncbi:hypothetical protein LOD99_15694 [Oopsacas minuta]|uniref:RRM domain-containing protein n=1 Tax=Oopsacas minuta TaxID=111878 RepID=A0AAV7K9P0_9METZ|nr:hypothetical protein LOD99_15694 [Oopsacas minuta]
MSDRESDNKHAKVFVGGISIHTTDLGFKEAFKPYGEITDSIILRDPETNRSRGFGFITFKLSDSVDTVLSGRPIVIDEREVDVKRAIPKEANNPQAHARTKKVFIGGLPNDITKEELTDFFRLKGPIDEIELVYKEGLFKGFGFITFEDCDTADKVIVDGEYDLRSNKRLCRVSKASTRGRQQQQYNNYQQMGGYGPPNFGGHQSHPAGSYYGGDGGEGDAYYGSDFNGGFHGHKSGYMPMSRGAYQGPSSGYSGSGGGGYSGSGGGGYSGSGGGGYSGSGGGGYSSSGGGGHSGMLQSPGYEARGFAQHQQQGGYSQGPSQYSEYMYGGGGHSGGGGGAGSGFPGGSSSQYMSYKGDSMRGSGSGGRGGRSRYKPY